MVIYILMVAADEAGDSLWVCVSLGLSAATHRQPAPKWQVDAVGRTPLPVGERV